METYAHMGNVTMSQAVSVHRFLLQGSSSTRCPSAELCCLTWCQSQSAPW